MFAALAAFIHRRPWWTLVACGLFLAVAIAVIVRGGRLTGGSFGDREAAQTQRLVEQVLGRFTMHDAIGDRIGVLLVAIMDLADAAFELYIGALLHHMRCFVRRCVQVRSADERDMVAYGVTHCV